MLRKLFLIGNILLLLIFVAAVVRDLSAPYWPNGWARAQITYRRKQADAETSAEAKQAILARRPEIKQILATDLGQIDRCTSCHQGMDSLATPTLSC